MWEKITAFIMAIVAFFTSLFGLTSWEYLELKDISYGENERHIMDLCLPKDSDGEVGLVLYIHGGAWIAGDKEGYYDNIKEICQKYGYATAAINYRYLSDTVSMHDIADDIDLSLKKIKEIGNENGININKVLLTGHSAGGHLSLFYAYSRRETAPITPVAVVSNCGPVDLTDDNYYYNADLGVNSELGSFETISWLFSIACGKSFTYETRDSATDELLAVSPISYIDENTVPTVINHGQKDTIVPFSNAVALANKLKQYGVKYDFNIYPNSGHGLSSDKKNKKIAQKLLEEYMLTYLGKEG